MHRQSGLPLDPRLVALSEELTIYIQAARHVMGITESDASAVDKITPKSECQLRCSTTRLEDGPVAWADVQSTASHTTRLADVFPYADPSPNLQ